MKVTGGEFVFRSKAEPGVEHVFLNQFTIYGAQSILRGAFWGDDLEWFVGLCAHNPADSISLSAVNEPAIANGYARQSLALNQANWPTIDTINGESYVESREFSFDLTDDTDIPVNRLFLTDGTYVVAISSPLPEGLGILDAPYSSTYRLFLR